MAESVLFMGWDRPIVGRERQAMQLWQKAMEYCSKLKTDGKIESFDAVMLQAHGGNLNAFIIVKGDAKKLAEIRREDTFSQYLVEGTYCLQGFGVIPGAIGAGLTKIVSQWAKLIGN